MRPEKLVTMHCPSCGADFDKQPVLLINPTDKSSHLEEQLLRKCRYCGTGLVRSVTKTKLTFKVEKLIAESRQSPSVPTQ